MRTLDTKLLSDCVYRLAAKAGLTLTDSCRTALLNASLNESGAAAFALGSIIENEKIAQREKMPVCQDTGMAVVLLEIGQDVHLTGAPLTEAVDDGVRRAYCEGHFRKSVCDPLTRVNTGDNTPARLHTEIVAGDKVKVTFLPKGFGSENMSRLYMLTPAEGRDGIVKAIVETVKLAGPAPARPSMWASGSVVRSTARRSSPRKRLRAMSAPATKEQMSPRSKKRRLKKSTRSGSARRASAEK